MAGAGGRAASLRALAFCNASRLGGAFGFVPGVRAGLRCLAAASHDETVLGALSMKSGTAKRRLATPSSRQAAHSTTSHCRKF
jgi:hypothetical protein